MAFAAALTVERVTTGTEVPFWVAATRAAYPNH